MRAFRTIIAAVADSMAPDGTLMRLRLRTTFDNLVTLLVAVLAIGLAVGYQLVGRWARRSDSSH
jgi:hypothetical protein